MEDVLGPVLGAGTQQEMNKRESLAFMERSFCWGEYKQGKKQTDRVPCDEKGTVERGCCANSELKRGQGAERTVGAPPYSRGW